VFTSRVGAVAHPDLVDLGEELVGRVPREDVRGPRIDPDPDQRERAGPLPAFVLPELVIPELDVRLLVGAFGMRLRELRRHVEIRDARTQAGVEDRRIETRIGGVQDRVGPDLADQRDDRVLARRVDRGGCEAVWLAESVDDRLRPGRVEVGHRDPVEERAALRNRREGRADAASSDNEDLHGAG
jgi:hypothetical protein